MNFNDADKSEFLYMFMNLHVLKVLDYLQTENSSATHTVK